MLFLALFSAGFCGFILRCVWHLREAHEIWVSAGLTYARRMWKTRRPDTSAQTNSPVTKLLSASADKESPVLNVCAPCECRQWLQKTKNQRREMEGEERTKGEGQQKERGRRGGEEVICAMLSLALHTTWTKIKNMSYNIHTHTYTGVCVCDFQNLLSATVTQMQPSWAL